jgi:hypothetical protein
MGVAGAISTHEGEGFMDDNELKQLLDKLSLQQAETLRALLNEKAAGAAEVLSATAVRELQQEADRYRAAQRQVLDGVGVLWNARLDLSIRQGDVEGIRSNLMRPVEFYDNCNCGGGGGGPACW